MADSDHILSRAPHRFPDGTGSIAALTGSHANRTASIAEYHRNAEAEPPAARRNAYDTPDIDKFLVIFLTRPPFPSASTNILSTQRKAPASVRPSRRACRSRRKTRRLGGPLSGSLPHFLLFFYVLFSHCYGIKTPTPPRAHLPRPHVSSPRTNIRRDRKLPALSSGSPPLARSPYRARWLFQASTFLRHRATKRRQASFRHCHR